ncbi:MAG: hypothetical protein M5U34_07760 [Chloroflexi bacterium]|nr:hypothetical protein [Chloroflexota bacterium]
MRFRFTPLTAIPTTPETAGATYTINNGVTSKTAVVSHQDNVGLWMSLGVYQLSAGNNTLRLTDLTPTDSGVGVWFDDVRFKPATSVEISHLSPPTMPGPRSQPCPLTGR